MTKKEIIDQISDRTGITRQAVEIIFNEGMSVLADAFANNESVFLRGFGTFEVVKRAAKKARNIAAGKTIEIPARSDVKFRLSKEVKERMNNEQATSEHGRSN